MAEFSEVIREHGRMCKSYANCKGCPLHEWNDCGNLCEMSDDMIDQFEQIVMGWSKEHPEQPTVDAVPAKPGRWIPIDRTSDKCSECEMISDRALMCCYGTPSTRYEQHPYCPWCGAKMSGEYIYDLETGELKDGEQDV